MRILRFIIFFLLLFGHLGWADWAIEPVRQFGLGDARSVQFLPDGSDLSVAGINVHFIDPESGATDHQFLDGQFSVYAQDISTDGDLLLAGGRNGTARLWRISTGELLWSYTLETSARIWSVALSPDANKALVGCTDDSTKVLNTNNGEEITALEGHSSDIMAVDFSPDGSLVLTASWDGTAKLWDLTEGMAVKTFTGHSDSISSAAFSPDGTQIATGSEDNTVKIWDLETGNLVRTLTGISAAYCSVAWSPDGSKIATGSSDDNARIWDASSGTLLRTLTGHPADIYSVAFSPDGSTLATASPGQIRSSYYCPEVRLWNVSTGNLERTFSGDKHGVTALAFTPDGQKVLTGSGDKAVRLWNVSTGENTQTITDYSGAICALDVSDDGTSFLSFGYYDESVKIRNVTTGAVVKTVPLWNSEIGEFYQTENAQLSPDGSHLFLAGCHFPRLEDIEFFCQLRSVPDGAVVRTFPTDGHGYLSPDGTKVLSAVDTALGLWDAATGAEIWTSSSTYSVVLMAAFSSDGTKIAHVSGSGEISLLDANSGELIRTMTTSIHRENIRCIAYSPNRNLIAVGTIADNIFLFDASTGEELLIQQTSDQVGGITFSPDGSKILTGEGDATATIWKISFPSAVDSSVNPKLWMSF